MSLLMTFGTFENGIGRSTVGGNSVACFAALVKSPGVYWMMMCAWMVFSSIWKPLTQAFQPRRPSYKN